MVLVGYNTCRGVLISFSRITDSWTWIWLWRPYFCSLGFYRCFPFKNKTSAATLVDFECSFTWVFFSQQQEDKRKVKFYFKAKHVLIKALSSKDFYRVFTCDSTKKVQDTLEMIYGVSPSVKQERMNTQIHEVEMPNEYEICSHGGSQPLEPLEFILEILF